MTIVYVTQTRDVRVTLHFESIDTSECILACDGGCSIHQAEWITFTDKNDLDSPAFAVCGSCLVKLERYAAKGEHTSDR